MQKLLSILVISALLSTSAGFQEAEPEAVPKTGPEAETQVEDKIEAKQEKEAPKKKKTEGPEMVEYSDEEIGIQGNWRKKKDWLKQAIEKNDSIQEMIASVQDFRKMFHEKFKNIDFELDKFYRQAGFDKGEIASLFKDIEEDIEQTKEKNKRLFTLSLSQIDEHSKDEARKIKKQYADAYKIEEQFKGYKDKLEQIKLDMKSIIDLDTSVRKRLETVDKQIDELNSQGDQAAKLSEKIWHIIDDKKARDIFYELSGQNEKVKSLQQYIKVDLSQDFDSVTNTIKEQIKKTNSDVQKLEDDGIIVVNRNARIEQERKKQLELIKHKEELAKLKKPSIKEEKKEKPKSLLEKIISAIKSFFTNIYEFLFG